MQDSLVSIIIPCKDIDSAVSHCFKKCLSLKSPKEIILLPNISSSITYPFIKVIPTGNIKPSAKRNIGIKQAQGDILAFIDSDAYPSADWIENALKYFVTHDVSVVGGPNLTPSESHPRERISGLLLSSLLCTGKFAARYTARKQYEKSELPSCNLFVRKDIFNYLQGFDEGVLTSEDAKLCFEVMRLGKKVLYAPDVFVYHHRRPLFLPYLRQIFRYAKDKAYLFKKSPHFMQSIYFLPSFFVLYVLVGMGASLFFSRFKIFYLISIGLYLLTVSVYGLFMGIKERSINVGWMTAIGLMFTHLTYGISFIGGWLQKS